MKKFLAFVLALLMFSMLAGCGAFQKGFEEALDEAVKEEAGAMDDSEVVLPEEGYAEGRIGTTFRTAFFDFCIDDVDSCESYEGYTPAEGMQLIDVTVTVKNTFGEDLPMFNSDFQIQWHDLGDKDEDFGIGVILAESETVMPEEYTQKRAETVTYHIIYEVPAEAKEFSVSYLEYYEDDTTGDVFFCFFEKA